MSMIIFDGAPTALDDTPINLLIAAREIVQTEHGTERHFWCGETGGIYTIGYSAFPYAQWPHERADAAIIEAAQKAKMNVSFSTTMHCMEIKLS